MYDICDIHSHILPGMDDGCRTVEESVAVMRLSKAGGVSKMLATPHYYPRESVASFLERRAKSEQILRQRLVLEDAPVPRFCCGAEVAYFQGVSRLDGIESLCLGNSRYLLLELPHSPWTGEVVRDLDNLCLQGITPILAHVERYLSGQSRQMVQRVLQTESLVQMNAGYLLRFWQSSRAVKLLKNNTVQLLGSDCHGLEYRPPRLGQAVKLLQKKKMHGVLASMEGLGNEIFQDASQ